MAILAIFAICLVRGFLSKLTKTKFALVNGQKCDETHNNILSINEGIEPPFLRSNQKIIFFMNK